MTNIDIKERKPSEVVSICVAKMSDALTELGYDFNSDPKSITLFQGNIFRIIRELEENQCKCEAEE